MLRDDRFSPGDDAPRSRSWTGFGAGLAAALWILASAAAAAGAESRAVPPERKGGPALVGLTVGSSPDPGGSQYQFADTLKAPTAPGGRWAEPAAACVDRPPVTAEARTTLRRPEDFARALNQLGYKTVLSQELTGTPLLTVNFNGYDVGIGFSSCTPEGCNVVQLLKLIGGITSNEVLYISDLETRRESYSHIYWNLDKKVFAFYNFIVIGDEGITVEIIVDNIVYFIRDNTRLADLMLKKRASKPSP